MKSAPNKDFSGFIELKESVFLKDGPAKPLSSKDFRVLSDGIKQESGFQQTTKS